MLATGSEQIPIVSVVSVQNGTNFHIHGHNTDDTSENVRQFLRDSELQP